MSPVPWLPVPMTPSVIRSFAAGRRPAGVVAHPGRMSGPAATAAPAIADRDKNSRRFIPGFTDFDITYLPAVD